MYNSLCAAYGQAYAVLKDTVRRHGLGYVEAYNGGFDKSAAPGYCRETFFIRDSNGGQAAGAASRRQVEVKAEYVADYENVLHQYETTVFPHFGFTVAPCPIKPKPLAPASEQSKVHRSPDKGSCQPVKYAREEEKKVYEELSPNYGPEHVERARIPASIKTEEPFIPGGEGLGGL